MSSWSTAPNDQSISNGINRLTANGDYYLCPVGTRGGQPFAFGARVDTAGHTATVQLWAEVAGKRTNLDAALVPTYGSPASGPNEYTTTGLRGATISGLTGAVILEAVQQWA